MVESVDGLSYRELEVFVKVAEHESFESASHVLGYTAAGVAAKMRQLEHRLSGPGAQVRLFYRHARGVTLTHEGEALLERAPTILELAEQARCEVKGAAEGVQGWLRVGTITTASV